MLLNGSRIAATFDSTLGSNGQAIDGNLVNVDSRGSALSDEDNNNRGADLLGNFDNNKDNLGSNEESEDIPVLQPVLIVGGVAQVLFAGSLKSIDEAVANLDSPICRICHCGDGDGDTLSPPEASPRSTPTHSSSQTNVPMSLDMNLITPCYCSGSLRYVHHYCLQQWIRSSNHKHCELCKYHFTMTVKHKPFLEWERLEMSPGERKKLLCNLLFNLISMFCVFWSIYVLIERATLEAKYGLLDWPFWTKMLVVSIGFLGGTVFLFVQLRLYFSIFLKWRQYNRVITIHNVNEEKKKQLQLQRNQKLSQSQPPLALESITTCK